MLHTWRNCFPLFHAYTALLLKETAGLTVPPGHTDMLLVRSRAMLMPASFSNCPWMSPKHRRTTTQLAVHRCQRAHPFQTVWQSSVAAPRALCRLVQVGGRLQRVQVGGFAGCPGSFPEGPRYPLHPLHPLEPTSLHRAGRGPVQARLTPL